MQEVLTRSFSMLTTSRPRGGRAGPIEDNKCINIVLVELSLPYSCMPLASNPTAAADG
jgi:hypothetical protein